jgi:prefoldin subunit 5|tara:strand:+ start:318 stop:542 length:225 start_codon:yes stop_codon:yes gene_type:complete
MDPEVSSLIAVYQKRLQDMTAQAIAYEARINVLTMQVNQLQQVVEQAQQAPAPAPAPKRTRTKKSGDATDAGTF